MRGTMNTEEHRRMLFFADTLRIALVAAANLRGQRQETIPTRYGVETGWMVKERELLTIMVNDRRAELGIGDPVNEDDVFAVEQSAAGHSDYAHKYTLRLANLAYDVEWRS